MASPVHGLGRALPSLRTSQESADRTAYARDLWPRHHLDVRAGRAAEHRPAAIAWPSSTEEVAALVAWAAREGVPLAPFGAGSGVCAGVLPREDVLVVDLKRMGRIRRLDADAPMVDVEAGHMGVPLEDALGRAGFTLGHFPSSILCSTVGGWVAARSAGQCSGAYGKIEDMVAALECVTGEGRVVTLRRRTGGPDLVPLVVGSEGTMAVVTGVTLRLHPAPTTRGFAAWSFPSTEHGWQAMRAMFQSGLRPAVSRLYDPFDAMLARRGGVGKEPGDRSRPRRPGAGGAALRALLRRPSALNELLHSGIGARALGGAMLVVVFEGVGDAPTEDVSRARLIADSMGARYEGEGPARRWLEHRYSVSYRQAPVFANGAFVDTMEVATRWSRLGALYDGVRRALGRYAFVMAHFSHAYPDGCCIYFSFAGSADPRLAGALGWDGACAATYDAAWRAALAAAVEAGGTLAHHHGVGRSKAPRLRAELGDGVDVVRALMRAFDPAGVLNPGNLLPRGDGRDADPSPPSAPAEPAPRDPVHLDRESLLASVDGGVALHAVEAALAARGLTLDLDPRVAGGEETIAAWLAQGARGSRDRWRDPADQLVAGLDATLSAGAHLSLRPSPRRAVGPDLGALLVGAGGRFGRIERAWLRVHPVGVPRPEAPPFRWDRDPPPTDGERALVDAIARSLGAPDPGQPGGQAIARPPST